MFVGNQFCEDKHAAGLCWLGGKAPYLSSELQHVIVESAAWYGRKHTHANKTKWGQLHTDLHMFTKIRRSRSKIRKKKKKKCKDLHHVDTATQDSIGQPISHGQKRTHMRDATATWIYELFFFLGDVFQLIKSLAAMASLPTMASTIVVYYIYDISMTCRLSMSFVLTELMTKHAKEERCW